jgi:murein DD-endopeptidase MepM/ murein hydrolase activator NlpD
MNSSALAAAAILSACAAGETQTAAPSPQPAPVEVPAPAVEIAAPDPARESPPAEATAALPDTGNPGGADPIAALALKGNFTQGGLVTGQAAPGAAVKLDGDPVMTDAEGRFIIGFGRDASATAQLTVTEKGGRIIRHTLAIADREFRIERIDGLDQSKVSGFTPEQLAKIEEDKAKKAKARAVTASTAYWANGFDWPVTGRISGVFGSQRILNGEEKTPHSGLDVAAPAGTAIRAPAPGVVRLADPDMYFEGGLVLIDHGLWLESAFLHMSRLDVKPGDIVEKGQIIGAVGATGRATGPHMHWSLKWVGRLVDPQLEMPPMPAPAAAKAAQ